MGVRLAPRSARRTWSIDVTFPNGHVGDVVADVRGRDLRTDGTGTALIIDELVVRIDIDAATRTISAVAVERGPGTLVDLDGIGTRAGFARHLAELFPGDGARRTLCYSALEDLSGALLVSGYAHLHAGLIAGREMAELAANMQADICAGWAADGPVISTMRAHGYNPVPIGPAVLSAGPSDAIGWHEMPPLAPPTVRRRRRIDVFAGGVDRRQRAEEHFRDSYAGGDGETVMHEYVVDAVVDAHSRVVSLQIDPRVLPWSECPSAAASAQNIVGTEISDLPARVRSELTGVSTCTHLNSTLCTLADVRSLARAL